MPPTPRPRAPIRAAPDDRLSFLERLHDCHVESECAALVLAWLAATVSVRGSLCAVLDSRQESLEPLAHDGLPPDLLEHVLADPDCREELMTLAFEGDGAIRLRTTPRLGHPSRLLRGVPLGRPGAGMRALGVLLFEPPAGQDAMEAVGWAARLLGDRLHSVRYERVRGERDRLQRENEWLGRILNAVTDPVLFTDADGRILVTNTAAETLLTAEDDVSEGRRRAVALNNMLFSASLARTGKAAAGTPRELPLVDPAEGRDLLFEAISAAAVVRGEETGIVSVLRDVTDLRRASEQIQETLGRLRAAEAEGRSERDRLLLILGSVAEPVLVTDAAGDIEIMNPPAERLFTANRASVEEASARVAANDAVFTTFLGNLIASPSPRWRGRLHLTDPITGSPVPMEAVSAEVREREGAPAAIITILHDLTEAMEKEALYEQVKRHSEDLRLRVREATAELAEQNERLRRQALELEQASNLKSQFLANMSHELRTPLNAIIGYTHMLGEGVSGELTVGQKDRLRRVDSNAKHLLRLINDLLDIARIEAGKMPVNQESFELPTLIAEVVEELEPLIENDRVEFTVELSPRLASVRSDRQKVKQILVNLLSNALKFTPRGFVRITAREDASSRNLCVAVADSGIGIAVENQRQIFDAFAQAQKTTTARGSGLGLAICRRLAEILGGSIHLVSEPERGSTFTLLLPLRGKGAR